MSGTPPHPPPHPPLSSGRGLRPYCQILGMRDLATMADTRPPCLSVSASWVCSQLEELCPVQRGSHSEAAAACWEHGVQENPPLDFSREARNHIFRCNFLNFKHWQLIHAVQSKEQADQSPHCRLIAVPVAREPPRLQAAIGLPPVL